MTAQRPSAVQRLEGLLARFGDDGGRAIRDITYRLEREGPAHYPSREWSKPDPARPVHVAWGDKVLQFEEGQLPLLEGVADKFEAEVTKPVYLIRRSPAIEKLLAQRSESEDGFAKLAKASADLVVNAGNTHLVIEGIRAHAQLTGTSPMTLVNAHQCLLVFAMGEDATMERIRSIVVPQKRSAPEKVAVKMILLRVRKIHAAVREANARLAEEMKDADRMKNLPADAREPIPPVPVDGGRGALIEYVNTVLAVRQRTQYNTQDLRKETLRTLGRQDMTDSALDEALRIAQVEEVMES